MQSKTAVVLGEILRVPRENGHNSGNITYLFSSDQDQQRDYIDGLTEVLVIFSFLFFVWAFILIVLKFLPDDMLTLSN